METVNKLGRESLKLLKENIPDDISYGTIRFVLASLGANNNLPV
jgi:hypothetical protein